MSLRYPIILNAPSTPCIIMFAWPQDDEGDYFNYLDMTQPQLDTITELLERAENKGWIRGEWYVGPIEKNTAPNAFEQAMESLRDAFEPYEEVDEAVRPFRNRTLNMTPEAECQWLIEYARLVYYERP